MLSGDRLASIATSEYGDPGNWRAIADANGIDDPFQVRPAGACSSPRREP